MVRRDTIQRNLDKTESRGMGPGGGINVSRQNASNCKGKMALPLPAMPSGPEEEKDFGHRPTLGESDPIAEQDHYDVEELTPKL